MSVPIFYSYSHKDETYKISLQTHLSILKRQGYIEGWDDRRIAPGEKWEEEINLNLKKAKIVLLLVSSNFLASDYCYDTETIFALEQHEKKNCIVIPIILKPFLWVKSHFSNLQALPEKGKPINTWRNKDEAWLSVSNGILKVIETIDSKKDDLADKEAESLVGSNLSKNAPAWSYTTNPFEFDTSTFLPCSIAPVLPELLIKFLEAFEGFYFSPLRIQKWGAKQNGFGDFANYSTMQIKNELERLLKLNKLKLTISKKGNKIYKIK